MESRKKACSSSKSANSGKKPALMIGRVKVRLLPFTNVAKKASSSHSKCLSVATLAGARHARRAVLPSNHFSGVDHKEGELIVCKPSKSDNHDPNASSSDR